MTYWSGETLKKRLPSLISDFDPEMIDCNAYTLKVGHEAYVTPDHKIQNPLRHTTEILEGDNKHISIPPGQFGFLLTEEIVKVPNDAMAFISIKAKVKFKGLINGSGFHVDPGFKGRLVFSVFNAGPNPIHLKRGQPLFLIWYANLDLDEDSIFVRQNTEVQYDIGLSQINGISGEIQSAHGLSEKLSQYERKMYRMKWQLGTVYIIIFGAFVYSTRGWLAETFGGILNGG